MRFPRHVAAAVLLGAGACRGSDAAGPRVGPPAHLSVTALPTSVVAAGTSAGTMTVQVTDAAGAAVSGALVLFTAGTLVTIAPDSARTDASGEARIAVTAGTKSGAATIVATAGDGKASAQAIVVIAPGPAVRIAVSPPSARIFYVGDTLRLDAVALDQYDNRLGAGALTFVAADQTLLRVDATGLVTALRQDGVSSVVVSAGPYSDSASITVTPVGVTPCTGVAPRSEPAVGELVTFSGVSAGCLGGSASGAEYALVAYNGTLDGAVSLSATVNAMGIALAPATPLETVSASASRTPVARGATAALVPDESFHLRLHERMRNTMSGRADGARRWYAARARTRPVARVGGYDVAPSYSAIPAAPSVGDVIRVNVNANQDCTSPAYRGARVVALGTRTIVLADTLNPAGGFTAADYARYAARFDTLVYPLDAAAFGEPTDIDGNGRIAVLFTRAVNELTPPDASSFVVGFFYGRDLLPATGAAGCAASNEGELLYMLVPDTAGAVNGNVRRTGFVDTITTSVLAHEMQHLINSSRRLYVNAAPETAETVWLNEGLSHVAEELLYFRESGQQMRSDLGDPAVRVNAPASYEFFKADIAQNMSRLIDYLGDPGNNSPTAADDKLATRGATWSFLRYAVDQLYAQDGDVWARFDNSTTSGFGTLHAVFGADADLSRLFRDWAVANLLDDWAGPADARFAHRSWNFRSLFDNTFGSYDAGRTVFTPIGSPLRVSALINGVNARVRVRGTSASYFRLAVAGGHEALLTFTSGQGIPSPSLQFIVVRTK